MICNLLGEGWTMEAGSDRAHTEWIGVAQSQLAVPSGTIPLVNRPPFILARLSTNRVCLELLNSFTQGDRNGRPGARSSCFCLSVALRLHYTLLHTDRGSYWGGGLLLQTLSLNLQGSYEYLMICDHKLVNLIIIRSWRKDSNGDL